MSKHKDTITEDIARDMLALLVLGAGPEGNRKALVASFGPAIVRLISRVYSDTTYIIAHIALTMGALGKETKRG